MKSHVVELFKLALKLSQNAYEELKDNISLVDEQFIETKFELLADEKDRKFQIKDLSRYSSFFRKKTESQQFLNLKENKNFQSIAKHWNSTVSSAFNTDKALEQFCNNVVIEHQTAYGLLFPACQAYLEKFAEALLYAINNGSYPNYCLIFFKNLWIDQPYTILMPFHLFQDDLPSMSIRRPIFEDYGKSHSLEKILMGDNISNLPMHIMQQTAVIEFFWYDKQFSKTKPSIECQLFIDSLENLFLLIDKSPVRMTKFRITSAFPGGPFSIFDSSPNQCTVIENLESKLRWIGDLMLPIYINQDKKKDEIERAFKYYKDSLFKNLNIKSSIALAMSGVETLYNPNKSSEITLRLSLYLATLLKYFNIEPLEVKKNMADGYDIRSQDSHGSKPKKKDIQELLKCSKNIHEYLRLSILLFQYSDLTQELILKDLRESMYTYKISASIEKSLKEIKIALFDTISNQEEI